jgi:hypothetical protein
MPKASRSRVAAAIAASLLSGTVMSADAAPVRPTDSRVNAITVSGTQPVGTFNGVPYVRTYGVVWGVIGQGEDVVYEYASEFEIIAPAPGQPAND